MDDRTVIDHIFQRYIGIRSLLGSFFLRCFGSCAAQQIVGQNAVIQAEPAALDTAPLMTGHALDIINKDLVAIFQLADHGIGGTCTLTDIDGRRTVYLSGGNGCKACHFVLLHDHVIIGVHQGDPALFAMTPLAAAHGGNFGNGYLFAVVQFCDHRIRRTGTGCLTHIDVIAGDGNCHIHRRLHLGIVGSRRNGKRGRNQAYQHSQCQKYAYDSLFHKLLSPLLL